MEKTSSKAIIKLFGERIKSYRIEFPLTQKELADKSGVSVRSIQNFEHGNDIQLSNLVKILNAMGLNNNLDMLIPDVSKKPSMYLDKNPKKKRVRKVKVQTESTFKWGDDQ